MLEQAEQFWKAIVAKVRNLIQTETANHMRAERYDVTTAPDGRVIGVKQPYGDTEIFIPYSREVSNAVVGDTVLVIWWGSMSNARAYYYANGFRGFVPGDSAVTSVNNMVGDVTLDASDVGALPDTTAIPAPATATPAALGTAAVGTSVKYAREDHVHKKPTASDVGAVPITGGTMTGQLKVPSVDATNYITAGGSHTFGDDGIYEEEIYGDYYITLRTDGNAPDANFNTINGNPVAAPATATPAALGTAAVGTSIKYAREDHVHKKPTLSELGAAAASDIPSPASATPAALGTAAVGTSIKYAREDHVHKKPTLSELGALSSATVFGGRNYLRAADNPGVKYPTPTNLSGYTYNPENGEYVLTALAASTGFTQLYIRDAVDIDCYEDLVGKTVMLSAQEISVSNSNCDPRIYLYGSSGTVGVALIPNTKKRIITIPSGLTYLGVLLRMSQTQSAVQAGDTVTIRGLKLELGDVVTDWTPDPTDLAAIPATATPKALGTAAVGTSTKYAREDHVHKLPTAAQVGAVPISGGTLTGTLNNSNGTPLRGIKYGTAAPTTSTLANGEIYLKYSASTTNSVSSPQMMSVGPIDAIEKAESGELQNISEEARSEAEELSE